MAYSDMKTCGDKIKLYRTQQKLTQKQLAEKAGVATISIQQYELNTRRPKIETLQKIATALNISIDSLRSDSDLMIDSFSTALNTMTDSVSHIMVTNTFKNTNLNFDEIQLLIANNAKKLTVEQKQQIIKLLLSED